MLIPENFEPAFDQLKSRGVLRLIRPGSLPQKIIDDIGELSSVNLIVLSCCDGHQFMNITGHTRDCCDEAKKLLGVASIGNDCFHWRTENGGPFVLTVPQLEYDWYRGERINVKAAILRSIERGRSLKQLDIVLMIGHGICAMVRDTFRHPEEYGEHMARAKEFMMSETGLPGNQVISWLQIHRRKGRRMYHVDHSEASQQLLAA